MTGDSCGTSTLTRRPTHGCGMAADQKKNQRMQHGKSASVVHSPGPCFIQNARQGTKKRRKGKAVKNASPSSFSFLPFLSQQSHCAQKGQRKRGKKKGKGAKDREGRFRGVRLGTRGIDVVRRGWRAVHRVDRGKKKKRSVSCVRQRSIPVRFDAAARLPTYRLRHF